MPDYYAALDLGTTGTRTVIFDTNGKVVSSAYEEWNSYFPSPVMVEQKAEEWWNAVKRTISVAISRGKINPENIKSVATTNQRETIVPVDKEGNPLHNAIVWQDRRTTEECNLIKNIVGVDKIYKTTGLTIDPYFSSSKILWIKKNKPEIYQKTYKFLLVHDYIVYKLTGKFITDYSNASRTMLFDINNLKFSEEIASKLELDLDKMPEPMPSASKVSNIITDETEFSKNTIVVTGGGDQQCAALGVGVVKDGRIKLTTGTGSFILSYIDKPKFDPKRRVLCSCHAVPGAWINEASIFSSGSALRWFRDEFCADINMEAEKKGISPYKLMDELVKKSPVGSNNVLFIPYLVGAGAPVWNPLARGVFVGLALGNKKQDLIRSIFEGICFEVRKNIEVFRELGNVIEEMRLTGGGARSDIWNQILADVLNIKCSKTENEESTSVGACILASYGAGDFKDISDAAENISKITKSWMPIAENTKQYDKLYALNLKLYKVINENNIFQELNE
ncbi:MAG: xylulokinase [Promethearchaeota archaeon]